MEGWEATVQQCHPLSAKVIVSLSRKSRGWKGSTCACCTDIEKNRWAATQAPRASWERCWGIPPDKLGSERSFFLPSAIDFVSK